MIQFCQKCHEMINISASDGLNHDPQPSHSHLPGSNLWFSRQCRSASGGLVRGHRATHRGLVATCHKPTRYDIGIYWPSMDISGNIGDGLSNNCAYHSIQENTQEDGPKCLRLRLPHSGKHSGGCGKIIQNVGGRIILSKLMEICRRDSGFKNLRVTG